VTGIGTHFVNKKIEERQKSEALGGSHQQQRENQTALNGMRRVCVCYKVRSVRAPKIAIHLPFFVAFVCVVFLLRASMASAGGQAYWLICVPNEVKNDEKRTRDTLVAKASFLGSIYPFVIPPLKVGTLDTLYALSDELGKLDVFVEGTVRKIERCYCDLFKSAADPKGDGDTFTTASVAAPKKGSGAASNPLSDLTVGDRKLSPDGFVEDFHWDHQRYAPKSSSIRQIAEKIDSEVKKSDEELKNQLQAFNDVRSNVIALERKETGSLLVRSLDPYVRKTDIIETANLTTLLIVVPKVKEKEFLTTYEILEDLNKEKEMAKMKEKERRDQQKAKDSVAAGGENESGAGGGQRDQKAVTDAKQQTVSGKPSSDGKSNQYNFEQTRVVRQCRAVVPRSARKLSNNRPAGGAAVDDDDEFVLYRIIVLKDGADLYKNICRDRRYTVRSYKFDPEQEKNDKQKKIEMEKHKDELWKHLVRWCQINFSDVFSAWLHVKAKRVFVESVLRYGLPVDFCPILIKPKKGLDKKLRGMLAEIYGRLTGADSSVGSELDSSEADISGVGPDFYPYVYVPIALSDVMLMAL